METGRICFAALCDGRLAVKPPESATNAEAKTEAPPAEANQSEAKPAENAEQKPAEKPATKTETKEVSPYTRVDYCESCWAAGKRPEAPLEMFSFWKTTVPEPTAKKKLFVDDSVLIDLFQRLDGRDTAEDTRLRFVLALILMRKRLLRYEGMVERKSPEAPEEWRMRPRGTDDEVIVVNPQLTESQIGEVSQHLSGILAEEV